MTGPLKLGKQAFHSRLIVGTGKYASFEQTRGARRGGRRRDGDRRGAAGESRRPEGEENLLDASRPSGSRSCPTPPAATPPRTRSAPCRLARELLGDELVKLEVIGDERTLFPDNEATLEAARSS